MSAENSALSARFVAARSKGPQDLLLIARDLPFTRPRAATPAKHTLYVPYSSIISVIDM